MSWFATNRRAVHAADGYSRSSHKVGVALVTSGPGVTNAVTGIATAYMDSIPMVIISGQVPTHAIGRGRVSGMRHGRHYASVRQAQLPGEDRQGNRDHHQESFLPRHYGSARTGAGRYSQGHHASSPAEFNYPKTIALRSYNPVTRGHVGQIKQAAQLLLEAKRPMVYAGGGVILSTTPHQQLTRTGATAGISLHQHVDGPRRLSGVPIRNSLGMLGMHGTFEANMAMQNCDVLLAVGARFDDRVIGNPQHYFAPNARSSTSTSIRRPFPSA